MRTGNSAQQQGLTPEAASMVKQAVALAKHRSHAQVTPLHVANTMLSASNGLLRRACLQSHSHPLQCKALEHCFNVALNRLPASPSSSSMLGPHHHHHSHHHQCPQISNAMVAAFKRAQAIQRRGNVESQQQQQQLAVKIEVEQLVISILDDPSVSRVMREAGFSSTEVKSNVEQAVSLEICSQENSKNNKNQDGERGQKKTTRLVCEEDVASVIDNMGKQKRRSVVIVGESVGCLEGVVRGVMDKVEKGDDIVMRGVKFVSLCLSDFSHVSRVEVEHKVEELRILAGRGCVLYLGDLKWVFEYKRQSSCRSWQHIPGVSCHHVSHLLLMSTNNKTREDNYCPVDHMVMEIRKMVSEEVNGERGRLWVMGIATFRDYMRCKNGNPSPEEDLWGLHPITIPAATLRLSLITHGDDPQNQSSGSKKCDDNGTSWLLLDGTEGDEHKKQPACNSDSSTTSSLPSWLQHYKKETKGTSPASSNHQINCTVQVGELCKKWNSMCSSIQTHSDQNALTLSPCSSTSGFSYEPKHLWISENDRKHNNEPTFRTYIPEITPTSSSSDVAAIEEADYATKFKELNSENLKTLCAALEEKAPRQKHIIPEIATTILQCRSGMLTRRKGGKKLKEDTWLFFQGADVESKEKIARELARLVFGCESSLASITLSSYSTAAEDCCRNKRLRDEQNCSYINRFADAVSSNPHRVFLVEDVDQADYCSQLGFVRAIERGRVEGCNGVVDLRDAIVVLSCESSLISSRRSSRACSPSSSSWGRQEDDDDDDDDVTNLEETSGCVCLDLNISVGDDYEDPSVDDIGLLESVDRRFVFRINQDL